jgi:predicted nucleotidyltransferase
MYPKLHNNNLLYKVLVGSRAYGTNIETSDYDYKGIYIQDHKDILGFSYKEQFEVGKDETYYELRRFLELCSSANPNILEMLFSTSHIIKHPVMDIILENKKLFLTKQCEVTFGGYAIAQIKKAKGLNKKINWEEQRVTRKNPIDFCYCAINGKSIEFTKFLRDTNLYQENVGLASLNHLPNCYALYYDMSTPTNRHNFRGVAFEQSNDIRLSSIPKGFKPLVECVYYNKDGYIQHCNDYRHYEEWLKNRNTNRYSKDTEIKYDVKNLMHCVRLLNCAIEIATEGNLTVLRHERAKLLDIRNGKVSYEEVINYAENVINNLKVAFANSNLKDKVDSKVIEDILIEMRKQYYKL